MRLRIATPLALVADEDGVLVLSAEDGTGRFGIQPHHADFLTSLSVGILSWESRDATRHYCAVRGGVLTVTGGKDISIATREAVLSDDLQTLDQTILAGFEADSDADRKERNDTIGLQLDAIRQIVQHLRPAG